MMSTSTTPMAFFSFVSLTDGGAAEHRAYNEWHQLDHRPENLALPGVAWGDRWRRGPEHRPLGMSSGEYADTDYVAMYWFRDPVKESMRAWDQLGADSFQWGRGPLIPGVERRMLAFFKPVKGYVSRSALVSPEVIAYRPQRGLWLTVTGQAEPHSAAAHARYAHTDRVRMPALMEVEGVAGAWTFTFSHGQQHTSLPFDGGGATQAPGSMRIELLYLDGDVAETSARILDTESELAPGAPEAEGEQVLMSGPRSTIVPWQDW
jgi:hypothetical protein